MTTPALHAYRDGRGAVGAPEPLYFVFDGLRHRLWARGPVTAYGNADTTPYGTQTTMMPYAVARSDFGAVFFVKTRTRAGIITAPLDDATHKRLGTNSGVLVRFVVDGSPAFVADIF